MASIKIDQVGLAIAGLIEGQIPNWQALVNDGRKISGINITVAIDEKGQRDYDITVDYVAPAPTNTISSPASDGAITPTK